MAFSVEFESIGSFLPEKRLSTSDLVKSLKIPAIKKFELLTGIKERRICGPGEDSLTLALNAAKDCLEYSDYQAEDLELIINCSITKYRNGVLQHYEPSISLSIKAAIGARKAMHLDISNACAGMLTGILIGEDFIQRGVVKNCMVVSGEYITGLNEHALKTIKTPLSSELASLTVGDAGAAVIIKEACSGYEGLSVEGFTTLCGYSHLCVARQSKRMPGAFMRTKAKKIHEVSIKESGPLIKRILENNGIGMGDIDYLIPHQTSKSAILSGSRYYSDYFGQRPGQVIINLKDYGNTASTSHFVCLKTLLQEGKFKAGDRIMLLCFASGLIIGTVLFQMNNMISRYGRED